MKNLIVLSFTLFTLSFSQKAISQENNNSHEHAFSIDLQDDLQLKELSRLEFAKLSKEERLKVWNKISSEQKLGYWKEKIEDLKEQFQEDESKLKFIQVIEDELSLQSFSEELNAETEQFFSDLVDKAIGEWKIESKFVYHTVFSLDNYTP